MKQNLLSRLPFLSLLTGKNLAEAAVSARSEPIEPTAGPWVDSPAAHRVASILTQGVALDQVEQAIELACSTDMPSAAARQLLEAVADLAAATKLAATPTAPALTGWAAERSAWEASRPTGRQRLERHRRGLRDAEARHAANVEAQAATPDALVDQILAIGAAARLDDLAPRALSLAERGARAVSVAPGEAIRGV